MVWKFRVFILSLFRYGNLSVRYMVLVDIFRDYIFMSCSIYLYVRRSIDVPDGTFIASERTMHPCYFRKALSYIPLGHAQYTIEAYDLHSNSHFYEPLLYFIYSESISSFYLVNNSL